MTQTLKSETEISLAVNLGSLELKNPVMTASGTFGYGLELQEFCPPEKLGAIISKGLSLTPWSGNPLPRLVETAGGLLNAIGLENMGLEKFIEQLGNIKKTGAVVGANILGREAADYALLSARLADTEIDFLELNISCPNLSAGGLSFGSDPDLAARLTAKAVAVAGNKPVIVKLPPLVTDIAGLARRVADAGATALSLINTVPGLAIDLETARPCLGNVTGGLSGTPIKPLALRQVLLCARAVHIPIIGVGGILTAQDALEFIMAGATAIQVGTATLIDPRAPLIILADMAQWLKEKNITLAQLRGSLKTG